MFLQKALKSDGMDRIAGFFGLGCTALLFLALRKSLNKMIAL